MTQTQERHQVSFSEWLTAARTTKQWSQEKLAEVAGISVKTVSAIEQGRIADPRTSTAGKLFSALGQSFFADF